MATYSTNLGLTLLATGEGAGTWGATTNTNLGTLLEQAVSGYVTGSLTAGTTLTLSIPNGATGDGRNMYLEFTGTGTTVLAPTNKKLYFIYNNCSSGTITFSTAGQPGVSVAKGEKKILVSNGTDIVEATTYLQASGSSATLTNLAVTNLTATSATVTTLSGASANITNLSSTSFQATSATVTAASITGLTATSATISKSARIGSTTAVYDASIPFEVKASTPGAGAAGTFKQENGAADSVALFWNSAASGDNQFLAFATEGSYTPRGTISYNRSGGVVAYNTTSDRRAKTIYGPVTNSGATIDSLNVYEGKMNWGTDVFPMMIADEMQSIVPYCVTGQPNAVNPDGSPKYQQVDYSSLIPLLIAEIQSLRERVAALGG